MPRPTATSDDAAPRRWWAAVAAFAALLLLALAALAWWVRPEWFPHAAGGTDRSSPLLSLAELLAGHSQDWRVARLKDNTAVLVIEFPDLATQGAAMNRVAALLEKADAPRDRVLDDAGLSALIARGGDTSQTFYQGHDYDGAGLARFYALVARQGQVLNAQEARMLALLLDQNLLARTPEGLRPVGTQAVITFTATQKDDPATAADETIDERRRESVLRHESSHGRYYTRPAYRDHCRRFWRETMNEAQRDAFRRYLGSLGYDRRDEELMLNEAQAFLLHTPDTRAFNAESVGIVESELADLRTRFWRAVPADADEPGAFKPALAPGATAAPAVPAAASRP